MGSDAGRLFGRGLPQTERVLVGLTDLRSLCPVVIGDVETLRSDCVAIDAIAERVRTRADA